MGSFKAIETGIILLTDQGVGVIFEKYNKKEILAHLRDSLMIH